MPALLCCSGESERDGVDGMRGPRPWLAPAMSVLLFACSATAPVPTPTPTTSASPAAAPAPPLRIGVLVPYTESAIDGDIGASQKKAADLYTKLHGGKIAGRDVVFIYSSESVDPKIDQTKITLLIEQEKVDVVLGGVNDTTAYALRGAVEAAKILYLDTSATANAVTRANAGCTPSCKSALVFRMSASAWQLSEPLGEWAATAGHREFFLAYEDDTLGTESAGGFVDGLALKGGRATGRITVPQGTGEWAKVIAAIRGQPTKDVFATFHTDDAEAFLGAWDASGLRAAGYRLYGPGPLTDVQVLRAAKQAAAGVITADIWSTELDNAETKSVIEAFRKEYKDDETGEPLTPDTYAIEMWDTMRALDLALGIAKGDARNVGALAAALESLTFGSPRGAFVFDKETHNPVQDVYIREVLASGAGVVNAIVDKRPKVIDPGR